MGLMRWNLPPILHILAKREKKYFFQLLAIFFTFRAYTNVRGCVRVCAPPVAGKGDGLESQQSLEFFLTRMMHQHNKTKIQIFDH